MYGLNEIEQAGGTAERLRPVAVIGAGGAGLAAAWALARSGRPVTLMEREPRAGGHINTIDAGPALGSPHPVPVDTGFIVYNERNYPNLVRLFGALDTETAASDMSFSVSLAGGAYEYRGSAGGLFAARRNLIDMGHWRMLRDMHRFNRQAPALAVDGTESLGRFLGRNGFSTDFARRYLLPMGAAIWSAPIATLLEFPAESFVRFFRNHALLDYRGRPVWRTVAGGTRSYADRILAHPLITLGTSAGVEAVIRSPAGPMVKCRGRMAETFSAVILATHADEALALLDRPDAAERRVLGAFGYQPNRAVLHRDPRLMPRRRRAWASWNYLGHPDGNGTEQLAVSYWMNRLQPLATDTDLFVTLNPPVEPRDVIADITYAHPVFDGPAIAAQPALADIQGTGGVWFAGAHFGFGFHEDACASGLAAAVMAGADLPWPELLGEATLRRLPALTALPARIEARSRSWALAAE
ncbi:FAD-dependent oxidoreductase [Tistrella mobilis]|uniref:NAD(P)/FAD-dependent oxidoreductase n=1 Tax=Tistrella mobilis TaxID=171437 RepID=UPI0035572121